MLLFLLLLALASGFTWLFRSRVVVWVLARVCSYFGCQVQAASCSWTSVKGLCILFTKGPLTEVTLHTASLNLSNGLAGSLLHLIRGSGIELDLEASGLNVVTREGYQSPSKRARRGSKPVGAPGQGVGSKGPPKWLLKVLPGLAANVRDVQVMLGSRKGLTLELVGLSLSSSQSEGEELEVMTVLEVSPIHVHPPIYGADDDERHPPLATCHGIGVGLLFRHVGKVWLDSVNISVGDIVAKPCQSMLLPLLELEAAKKLQAQAQDNLMRRHSMAELHSQKQDSNPAEGLCKLMGVLPGKVSVRVPYVCVQLTEDGPHLTGWRMGATLNTLVLVGENPFNSSRSQTSPDQGGVLAQSQTNPDEAGPLQITFSSGQMLVLAEAPVLGRIATLEVNRISMKVELEGDDLDGSPPIEGVLSCELAVNVHTLEGTIYQPALLPLLEGVNALSAAAEEAARLALAAAVLDPSQNGAASLNLAAPPRGSSSVGGGLGPPSVRLSHPRNRPPSPGLQLELTASISLWDDVSLLLSAEPAGVAHCLAIRELGFHTKPVWPKPTLQELSSFCPALPGNQLRRSATSRRVKRFYTMQRPHGSPSGVAEVAPKDVQYAGVHTTDFSQPTIFSPALKRSWGIRVTGPASVDENSPDQAIPEEEAEQDTSSVSCATSVPPKVLFRSRGNRAMMESAAAETESSLLAQAANSVVDDAAQDRDESEDENEAAPAVPNVHSLQRQASRVSIISNVSSEASSATSLRHRSRLARAVGFTDREANAAAAVAAATASLDSGDLNTISPSRLAAAAAVATAASQAAAADSGATAKPQPLSQPHTPPHTQPHSQPHSQPHTPQPPTQPQPLGAQTSVPTPAGSPAKGIARAPSLPQLPQHTAGDHLRGRSASRDASTTNTPRATPDKRSPDHSQQVSPEPPPPGQESAFYVNYLLITSSYEGFHASKPTQVLSIPFLEVKHCISPSALIASADDDDTQGSALALKSTHSPPEKEEVHVIMKKVKIFLSHALVTLVVDLATQLLTELHTHQRQRQGSSPPTPATRWDDALVLNSGGLGARSPSPLSVGAAPMGPQSPSLEPKPSTPRLRGQATGLLPSIRTTTGSGFDELARGGLPPKPSKAGGPTLVVLGVEGFHVTITHPISLVPGFTSYAPSASCLVAKQMFSIAALKAEVAPAAGWAIGVVRSAQFTHSIHPTAATTPSQPNHQHPMYKNTLMNIKRLELQCHDGRADVEAGQGSSSSRDDGSPNHAHRFGAASYRPNPLGSPRFDSPKFSDASDPGNRAAPDPKLVKVEVEGLKLNADVDSLLVEMSLAKYLVAEAQKLVRAVEVGEGPEPQAQASQSASAASAAVSSLSAAAAAASAASAAAGLVAVAASAVCPVGVGSVLNQPPLSHHAMHPLRRTSFNNSPRAVPHPVGRGEDFSPARATHTQAHGPSGPSGEATTDPPFIFELRSFDLAVDVSIGDCDHVSLVVGHIKASSLLQEAAVESLSLNINERPILTAKALTLGLLSQPPESSAPSHQAGQGGSGGGPHSQRGQGSQAGNGSGPHSQRGQGSQAGSGSGPQSQRGQGSQAGSHPPYRFKHTRQSHVQGGGQRRLAVDIEEIEISACPPLGPVHYTPMRTSMRTQMNMRRSATLGGSSAADAATQRTGIRRQAAYERCKIQVPCSAGGVPSPIGKLSPSFSDDLDSMGSPARTPDKPEPRKVLSLEVGAELFIINIPHDEALMRVYVLGEIWGEAVEQVLVPAIAELSASLSVLKPGAGEAGPAAQGIGGGGMGRRTASGASTPAQPTEPEFLEVVLEVQRFIISIQQHPMESWMALHGQALQRTAAQRQLWDRMLSGLSDLEKTQTPTTDFQWEAPSQAKGKAKAKQPLPPKGKMLRVSNSGIADSAPPSLTATTASGQSLASDSDSLSDDGGSVLIGDQIPTANVNVDTGPMGQWQQVMRDIGLSYISTCTAIAAASQSAEHHKGAACTISAAQGSAVVVVCLKCPSNHAAASERIAQIDPPSEGVNFSKVVPLSLDAEVGDITLQLGGANAPPALSLPSLILSGWVIRGRQLTAAPCTYSQDFRVGTFHSASVSLPIKGCKAPMKTYTDLKLEVDELGVRAGVGLEPALAQVVNALKKRVVPPDDLNSDGSAPEEPESSLAPWDKMRYVWRGNLRISCRHFSAVVPASHHPSLLPHEPFLQASAQTLVISISTHRLDITATSLAAVAHVRPPDAGPGEPLVVVPYLFVPLINLGLHFKWKLPAGRDALQHHIYPLDFVVEEEPVAGCSPFGGAPLKVQAPLEPVAGCSPLGGPPLGHSPLGESSLGRAPLKVQAPLEPATVIAAEGLNLGVDVSFKSNYSEVNHAGGKTKQSSPAKTSPRSPGSTSEPLDSGRPIKSHFVNDWPLLHPSVMPRLYIGELQIHFIKHFSSIIVNAPVMVRGASKRSTYFDGPRHVATKSMHVNTNSMHADTPHTEDSPNQPQPSNKPLKSGLKASPSKDTLAAMAVQRRVLFNTHVDISLVPEQLVTTPPQHWSADSIPATSQDHNTDSKTTETKAATLARRSTKPADLITNPSPPPLHQQSAPKPPVTSPPVPKPTRLPKPLGLVLSRLNLALTADQVEIYHDSQDPSDPSDLVFLRGTNLRYDTSFTFTPTVQTVVRSNRTYTTPGTQSAMSALSLEAYDLKLVKPHDDAAALAAVAVPAGGAASRRPPKAGHGKSQSWGAGNGVSSKVASEAKGMKLTRQETDKLVTDVDFGGGLIMSAACLLLKQGKPANLALSMRHRNVKAGLAAQDMSRPIRIVAQDLRFLCSAALRDTCIATFEHIIAAFRMPTPTRLAKLQQMHSNGLWREGSGLHQYSNPHTSMEVDLPASTIAEIQGLRSRGASMAGGLPVDYRKVSPPPRGGVRSRQIEAQARELVRVEEEDIIRRIKMKKVQSQDPEGAAHNSDDENTVRGADSAGLDSFSEFTRFNPDGLTAAPVRVQRYEVEFVHVQVNFDPEDGGGGGRVLLSADSALLAGYLLPTSQQVITSFNMEHIQAYTIRNEGGVNTCARPPWLQIQNGKICPQTAIASSHLRVQKVLDPFRLHVTSTRPQELGASVPDATTSCNQGSGGSLPGSPTDSPNTLPSLASMKQAPKRISSPSFNDVGNGDNGASITPQQTLSISVPTIIGELDSWQFEVLAEVITSIIARPPPQVKLLLPREPSKPSVDSSPEVVAGMVRVQHMEEELRCLQHELCTVSVHSVDLQMAANVVPAKSSPHQSSVSFTGSPSAGFKEGVGLIFSSPSSSSTGPTMRGLPGTGLPPAPDRGLGGGGGWTGGQRPPPPMLHSATMNFTCSTLSSAYTSSHASLFSQDHAPHTSGMLMLQGPLARSSTEHQQLYRGGGVFGGSGTSTSQSVYNALNSSGVQIVDEHGMLVALKHMSASLSPAQSQVAHHMSSYTDRGGSKGHRHRSMIVLRNQDIMIQWCAHQALRSRQGVDTAQEKLTRVRAETEVLLAPRRTLQSSRSVLVKLDHFGWKLKSGKGGPAFVQAELEGVTYMTMLDRDYTGSTKLQLTSVAMRDLQGLLGSAPGSLVGPILTVWNPDSSWEGDDALSIYTIHGGLTHEGAFVYDHIEVVLHPLIIHLTSNLANALQDYFQLKEEVEEDTGKKPGKDESPLLEKTASVGQSSSTSPNLPKSGPPSSRQALSKKWYHRRSYSVDVSNSATASPGGSPSPGGSQDNPTNSSLTTRTSMLAERDDSLWLPMRGMDHSSAALLNSGGGVAASGMRRGSTTQSLNRSSKDNQAKAAMDKIEPNRYGTMYRLSNQPDTSQQKKGVTKKGDKAKRAMLFRHVRINRMHARITYQGSPFSITDFGLVLDASVYHNTRGSLKTLLNKYKWDLIKSIVRSAAGRQARKMQELGGVTGNKGAPGGAAGGDKEEEEVAKAAALFRGRGNLPGSSLKSGIKSWFSRDKSPPQEGGSRTPLNSTTNSSTADDDATYLKLIRNAIRQRQKQQKLALILGPNVPLMPTVRQMG